jgi:hypothetical protein
MAWIISGQALDGQHANLELRNAAWRELTPGFLDDILDGLCNILAAFRNETWGWSKLLS